MWFWGSGPVWVVVKGTGKAGEAAGDWIWVPKVAVV